jgi:hypothetical protein
MLVVVDYGCVSGCCGSDCGSVWLCVVVVVPAVPAAPAVVVPTVFPT